MKDVDTKVSIIIPTYKEAENLLALIPQLIKKFNPFEIIVVDDDSQDGTPDAIDYLDEKYCKDNPSKIISIERHGQRGIGSAIAKGYDEAKGDILLSIDADLSMDLDDVPKLLDKIHEGYDVVVGSRYVPGGKNRKEAFLPRVASIMGNRLFEMAFKLPVHDVSMNFRALKKSVWKDIRTKEKDNVMLLEMLVNAVKKSYKIAEIPTSFGERTIGESKTNIWKLAPRYLAFILRQ